MKAYNTYKGLVFIITTAVVFFLWDLITILSAENMVLKAAFGGIVSLGTYRLILNLLDFLLQKSMRIKKLVFGNSYMEGIWVGCYIGVEKLPNIYIECFEQDFNGLVIRGRCYTWDGTFKGSWVSERVDIDEDKGILSYTYETDMMCNNHKNQGFAVFNFVRDDKNHAPNSLIGFTSDIYTARKYLSREIKIEMKTSSDLEMMKIAKELYAENELFFKQ